MLHNPNRIIGKYSNQKPGPTILCVAGIHGNEPAGVIAAERVQSNLDKIQVSMNGEFIALRGNLQALACKERYLDEDLNRIWEAGRITEISNEAALPDQGKQKSS